MIGCIIQARMGSTRLPGKVLRCIEEDKTVLYFVIKQLQESNLIDKIIVATTKLEEDNRIEDYSKSLGIECFRGSSDNVLERYYQCAKKFSVSTIVRIPSDKPLIDPEIVDKIVEEFRNNSFDYVTNFVSEPTFPSNTEINSLETKFNNFPSGTEVEVFSINALEIAFNNAKLPSEKEHVTPYFPNHKDDFKIKQIENTKDLVHLRWAVDRAEDLDLIKKIVLKIKKRPVLMQDIIELFKREPRLVEINKEVDGKEGDLKSMKEDKEFLQGVKNEEEN